MQNQIKAPLAPSSKATFLTTQTASILKELEQTKNAPKADFGMILP